MKPKLEEAIYGGRQRYTKSYSHDEVPNVLGRGELKKDYNMVIRVQSDSELDVINIVYINDNEPYNSVTVSYDSIDRVYDSIDQMFLTLSKTTRDSYNFQTLALDEIRFFFADNPKSLMSAANAYAKRHNVTFRCKTLSGGKVSVERTQ